MEGHYNYLSHLTSDPDWQEFSLAIALGVTVVLIARAATARLATAGGIEAALIPEERPSLFGFLDFVVEKFIAFHDSILGKENRHHAPFSGSIFLFILLANLLGLIPGMPAITTTVWVNVAMALTVFVYFNWVGIKTHGLLGYLKHFCGPIWWLAWLMFPLEILSTTLRVLTLNLRLYWNISADHIVLGIFHQLIPGGLPIPVLFYGLGTFVSFMQAFIFSLLTMVYILLASQHEEGDQH